jgi:hypothetical protein
VFRVQTVTGQLKFYDSNLRNLGDFVVTGPTASVTLEAYYYGSSYYVYASDGNILDVLPGSTFSLLQNATLSNLARSWTTAGKIRFHDNLLADGSDVQLIVPYGEVEFVDSTAILPLMVLNGGDLRLTSTSVVTVVPRTFRMESDDSYIRGTGDVVFSGTLHWTKGRMIDSATTTITGTLLIEPPTSSSYVYLQGARTLATNGAV